MIFAFFTLACRDWVVDDYDHVWENLFVLAIYVGDEQGVVQFESWFFLRVFNNPFDAFRVAFVLRVFVPRRWERDDQ